MYMWTFFSVLLSGDMIIGMVSYFYHMISWIIEKWNIQPKMILTGPKFNTRVSSHNTEGVSPQSPVFSNRLGCCLWKYLSVTDKEKFDSTRNNNLLIAIKYASVYDLWPEKRQRGTNASNWWANRFIGWHDFKFQGLQKCIYKTLPLLQYIKLFCPITELFA